MFKPIQCTNCLFGPRVYQPRREETCQLHVNSKGEDQLAHTGSLISAFVIRSIQSIFVDLLLL